MTGNSQIPKDILLNNLKELMPEIFSEGKVDWERLKATLGEDINFNNERYVLNWAGKSDAFRVLQAPSTRTLIPAKEESINFDETENIFIEGENLEVLKILQKSYFGKIKMIYIDPPYNTGNDSFIYPDKFSETKEEYQKRVGDKDEEGYMTKEGMFRKNSKENGHYHSNWLNMMYSRLFLARNLLSTDGAIFISIDDNEVHNLRNMMNEIFGEENFIASNVWQKRYSRENREIIGDVHEYILVYAKYIEVFKETKKFISPTDAQLKVYKNPDNDPKGDWRPIPMTAQAGHATKDQFYEIAAPGGNKFNPPPGRCWSITEKKFLELLNEGKIYFGKDNNSQPNLIRYKTEIEGFAPWTWWPSNEVGHTDEAKKELFRLLGKFDGFDTPKPTRLLKRIVEIGTDTDSLILDFFSGSSTLAQAVIEQNIEDKGSRKFICVQLPEPIDESSEAFQAGYNTIADIGKDRIRKVIEEINQNQKGKLDFDNESKQDFGFKVFKLSDSNFKVWRQQNIETAEELEKQMELFTDPVSKEALYDFMVYELLIKSGYDLNCQIKHENNIYFVNSNEMILLLESVSKDIISKVIKTNPQKVVALDKLFEGNDQLKTNTALQMKDAGIDFKTI